MQPQNVVLALVMVGLLLYQTIYHSKLTEPLKRLLSVIVIIVVVLWLVSQTLVQRPCPSVPDPPAKSEPRLQH